MSWSCSCRDGILPRCNSGWPLGKLTGAARSLYERIPTTEELEGSGFTQEDYLTDDFDVWPENWPYVEVFSLMSSQWNIGMGGAIGLNYTVLFDLLTRKGFSGDEWWVALDSIRVMESAALDEMQKK